MDRLVRPIVRRVRKAKRVGQIVDAVYKHLESSRSGYVPTANYASQAGHPCARHLPYQRLNWQDKPLPEVRRLLIFRDGNMHEEDVMQLLRDAGLQVIEQQRPFEWKELQVRGKIDAKVKFPDSNVIPIEVKSIAAHSFAKINSVKDMLESNKPWVVGYVGQMMLYLLMMNAEVGIILFKNKATGELKEIEVRLDFAYAEKLCQKLEVVNKHVQNGTYPDRITDRAVCQMCDFKHVCLPDEVSDMVVLDDDPEVLEKLDRLEELKAMAAEHAEIQEELKARWQKRQQGTYLVGTKYQVVVSSYEKKGYQVPAKAVTRVQITSLDKTQATDEGGAA